MSDERGPQIVVNGECVGYGAPGMLAALAEMTSGPRVWSLRRGAGPRPPAGARRIDRSTDFGNPFRVEHYGQEGAVRAYREWIRLPIQAPLRAQMRRELRGKDLICWCTYPGQEPKQECHGDVVLEVANGEEPG